MVLGIGGSTVEIIIRARDEFSATMNRASLSMKSFRKAAIGAGIAGVAIAGGFAKALKTSIDFESAFTGVRKTVELTEEGFADLEQRFKDLSTVTPITFVELSKIGEIAGQLGVEGVDNLEKFTKTIADISVTTNLTAEDAATSFARIANVMQEPLDNVDKMGSVVVALGNNFATTENEIAEFAKRIAGAGKIVGLSTGEVFGISAALSSVGIEAEAGGSAVQKALLQINKSVIEGGEELNIFATTAGLTSDEFSKLWETDAAGAFEKFILGLGQQGDNAQKILKDVKLGGIRTTRAFLSLANAGDLITETLQVQGVAWNENSALTEEAQKRYETLESQLEIAKNKFALLGDEIGDRIAPFIQNILIPALDKLIGFWDKLSPKMQDSILIIAAVTAGVFLLAAAVALITLVSSPWLFILLGIGIAIGLLIIFFKDLVKFTQKAMIIMVLAWESLRDTVIIVWAVMKNAAIAVWNFIIDFIARKIQLAIDFLNVLIKTANLLPKINIDIIPNVDFSSVKGKLTDIGELRARLADERIETSATLTQRAGIEVNIENVNGLDGESVAEALQEVLDQKILT